jgi:hypothetical protein
VPEEVWAELVRECDGVGAVSWEWQAADGVMGKNRFCGDARGPNPHGGPLGVAVDGANVHDTKLLERAIDAIVVERPDPRAGDPEPVPGQGL